MPPKLSVEALPKPIQELKELMIACPGGLTVEGIAKIPHNIRTKAYGASDIRLEACFPDKHAEYCNVDAIVKREWLRSPMLDPASGGSARTATERSTLHVSMKIKV